MKAKLIKTDKDNYILVDSTKGVYDKGYLIGSSRESDVNKLSKQNCDEIFEVVDVYSQVEDIVKTICPDDRGKDVIYGTGMAVGIQCFNKAMELNKDKVFTLEDMIRISEFVKIIAQSEPHITAKELVSSYVQSLQQPTEIEVEFETQCLDPTCDGVNKKGVCIPGNKPKLDENGCLILKKVMS
jgi:hypothetical protein